MLLNCRPAQWFQCDYAMIDLGQFSGSESRMGQVNPGTYKGGVESRRATFLLMWQSGDQVARVVTPQETDAESADSACEDVRPCRDRQHTAIAADTARGAACLGGNSGHRGVGMQVDWV